MPSFKMIYSLLSEIRYHLIEHKKKECGKSINYKFITLKK